MLESWSEIAKTQRVDMQDMVDAGALDAVILPQDMRGIVEHELLDAHDAAIFGTAKSKAVFQGMQKDLTSIPHQEESTHAVQSA